MTVPYIEKQKQRNYSLKFCIKLILGTSPIDINFSVYQKKSKQLKYTIFYKILLILLIFHDGKSLEGKMLS